MKDSDLFFIYSGLSILNFIFVIFINLVYFDKIPANLLPLMSIIMAVIGFILLYLAYNKRDEIIKKRDIEVTRAVLKDIGKGK